MGKITVAALKQQIGGALGQVISGGINRYVIVEVISNGVKVVCLYGTLMSDPDEVLELPDTAELFVDNKEQWKRDFHERWLVIAKKFPAIGE